MPQDFTPLAVRAEKIETEAGRLHNELFRYGAARACDLALANQVHKLARVVHDMARETLPPDTVTALEGALADSAAGLTTEPLAPPSLPNVMQPLTDRLWLLGQEYGPLGVALVAAQLSSPTVVIARLSSPDAGVAQAPEGGPAETDAACRDLSRDRAHPTDQYAPTATAALTAILRTAPVVEDGNCPVAIAGLLIEQLGKFVAEYARTDEA